MIRTPSSRPRRTRSGRPARRIPPGKDPRPASQPHADGRLVYAARGGEGGLQGRRHRVPSRPGGLVAHDAQARLQLVGSERVHVLDQAVGQRRPHAAVPPASRLPAQQRQLARRAGGVGGRIAVGAAVFTDEGPLLVVQLDMGGEQPYRQPAPCVLGAARVEVPTPDGDLAELVGLALHVLDGHERLPGKAGQGHPVLHEQLRFWLPLDPVRLVGQPHAPVEERPVVALGAADGRDGHEQVAPDHANLVLDAALLVARVRVAEREVEPVMRGARLEEPRRAHPAAHAAAHAGGVVEHYARWHAADVLEDVLQSLADALGVLSREHLGESDVGERERQHEEAQPAPEPVDIEVRLAEVGLGLAWLPHEVEVAAPGLAPLGALL